MIFIRLVVTYHERSCKERRSVRSLASGTVFSILVIWSAFASWRISLAGLFGYGAREKDIDMVFSIPSWFFSRWLRLEFNLYAKSTTQ